MRHLLAFLLLTAPAFADNHKPPHVDLVIALDVSGSMRGLIDATRMKLWNVVRLLGQAQPRPQLRVGLVTFGGKFHDPRAGYVRRELDLTTDLDMVSAKLFALAARGSQEYVARTVQTATRDMSWDQDPSTLKILFVAGNESAEQDPAVTLRSAMTEARRRGIHVNTIYCGKPEAVEAGPWRVAAALGGGEFAAIDHTRSHLARVTPYDAEMGRLSTELSKTYVGYGADAANRHANQVAQDKRAAADGAPVAAERAAAKATAAYDNSDWDLVDALSRNKNVKDLPDDVARMSEAERQGWLRARLADRTQIQRRILEVAEKREAYLATTTATPTTPASAVVSAEPTPDPARPAPARAAKAGHTRPAQSSMDEALTGTVRKQATANGLAF